MEKFLSILLAAFLLITFWPVDRALSQGPELIARWPLDENSGDVVHDVVGGNDGKFAGGKIEWVQAKFENGLQFDGTVGISVEIPRNPGLEPVDSLTLIAWVKFNAMSGEQEVVSYADSYFIRMNGVFKGFIHQEGGWPQAVGQTGLDVDKWYFAAMTYDGQEVKIYVDGKPDASRSAPGKISYSDIPLRFGADAHNDARWLNGILDEVQIWDRAMTDDEVMAAYESPLPSIAVSPKGSLTTTWGNVKSAL